MHNPLIKWSGSKRSQSEEIVSYFPKEIDTFYEPFCGSCSITYQLIESIIKGERKVNKIVCSDLNFDLINLYNLIFNDDSREKLFKLYEEFHNKIISYETKKEKQEYYNIIRDKYNSCEKDDEMRPYYFFCLDRTCFNGLIRYNKDGKFTTSFHSIGNRNGIEPKKLQSIFKTWVEKINYCKEHLNIEFISGSYDKVLENVNENDFVYLDPPYGHTKGMWFNQEFSQDYLFENLGKLKSKWILSYDGISGDVDNTIKLPTTLYKKHLYINSGLSSFKRIKNSGLNDVKESLYLNF